MKQVYSVICGILLFAGANAWADDLASGRPAKLQCQVAAAPRGLVKSFKIESLDSIKPDSNIEDAPLMDPIDDKQTKKTGLLTVAFSNECDNFYEVIFLQQNLADLKEKKLVFVTGTLSGWGADSEEATADVKYSLTCKIP